MKTIFGILFVSLILSSCGYQGHYRYECQDPANWENNECNPPECKVAGTCTTDIIGFDPNEQPEGESDE
jgi:hypothetical protein